MFIAIPFAIFALFCLYAATHDLCDGPRKAEYQCEDSR